MRPATAALRRPRDERWCNIRTIRLSEDVIEYFKAMAEESGVPYQSLINLCHRDCADKHPKVAAIQWQPWEVLSPALYGAQGAILQPL